MPEKNTIFEENYQKYLDQVAKIDLALLPERLGVKVHDDEVVIPFFGNPYRISGKRIVGPDGRKAGYALSVILCKYLLLCPNHHPVADEWITYKDFKDAAPLIHYFSNNVQQAIAAHFSNRLPDLLSAAEKLGGRRPAIDVSYDFSACFDPLPRVPVLLVFNDADEEFPAQCSVLFEKRARNYLDMECLAMVGGALVQYLKDKSE